MPGVEELLGPVAARAQAEVQRRLGGFLGGMLRAYLPQVWVFVTDRGTASLRVAPDGSASVVPGPLAPADVTIEVGHARLEAALAGRADAGGTPPRVTTHSAKGKAAFDYLRGRLGL